MPLVVTGYPEFKARKPKYLIETPTYAVHPQGADLVVKGPVVLMGNRTYPLSAEIESLRAESGFFVRKEANVELRLPVGAIEVTPARDSVLWTDRTREALVRSVTVMDEDLPIRIQELVKEAATEWDAHARLHKVPYGLSSGLHVDWNGVRVSYYGMQIHWRKLLCRDSAASLREASWDTAGRRHHQSVKYKSAVVGDKTLDSAVLPADTWQIVVYDDLPVSGGAAPRAAHHQHARGTSSGAYVFRSNVITFENLQEHLRGFPVLLASQLPPAPKSDNRDPNLARLGPHCRAFQHENYWIREREAWTAAGDLPEGEKFYVRMEKGTSSDIHQSSLRSLVKAAITLEVLPEGVTIYGIPRTLAKFEQDSEFVSLLPWIKAKGLDLQKKNSDLLSLGAYAEDLHELALFELFLNLRFDERITKGTQLHTLLMKLRVYKDKQHEYKRLLSFLESIPGFKLEVRPLLSATAEEVLEPYWILKALFCNRGHQRHYAIKDYLASVLKHDSAEIIRQINAVDAARTQPTAL